MSVDYKKQQEEMQQRLVLATDLPLLQGVKFNGMV